MIVIPRAATWGGGLLSDLKVVNYLLSTTPKAFSAAASCGSAFFKISSALAFWTSISATSTSSSFSLATAAVWFFSTLIWITSISARIVSTSFVSALTGIPVDKNVAMTGEITLRGTVLPIGGLKEKALAAHRGGIKKIIFPKENESEIEDIPPTVRAELELVPAAHVDEVLFEALICTGPKDFEKILDRKNSRDEVLFHDEGDDDEEGGKDKPTGGVVTH